MFFQKIKYKLDKFLNRLTFRPIHLNDIIEICFFIALVIWLSVNIITTFNKGLDNIQSFDNEQSKLSALRDENAVLSEEVKRYSSVEYEQIYAKENLNLATKPETLYYVNRNTSPTEIDKLPEETTRITLQDSIYWWKKLLLGL